MVDNLFLLKHNDLNNSNNGRLSKEQSLNTDDDSVTTGDLIQKDDSVTQSNENLLSVDGQNKRSLLSLNSPSIDSVNDPEGSVSDNPIGEKTKKKNKRRAAERMDSIDQHRRSQVKKRPWFLKVDLTKPILFFAFLFLIYFMWVKRDVWIPRLLTSNSRIRLIALRNEEKLQEHKDSHSTPNSSLVSSNQDEIINDKNDNNEQSPLEDDDDDDDIPTVSNKQQSQKLNLRIRRNKMSFTRDRPMKKHRHSRHQIIDDEEDVEDEDDNGDLTDSTTTATTAETIVTSSKRHRHHRVRSDQIKNSLNGKTSVIIRPHDDIVEQLRKLIRSHGKHRDLLTLLTKETGLNKAKINRLIHQKDLSVITLDTFISLLNSFDSTILIVSK